MNKKLSEENHRQTVEPSEEARADRALIEAAQNGDTRAFGQLVRRYQKRLFRYLYGLLGSFDMTEDMVQEAFIKAFQNIKRFKIGYEFYPWLSRIARNNAYNHLHREERKESLNSLQEKGFDPASNDLGPMSKLLEGESKQRFYQAVMALPVQYRSVFVLRHFEDMGYADIASYLKIPPGTVDSRLYRARQMLLEELKDLL